MVMHVTIRFAPNALERAVYKMQGLFWFGGNLENLWFGGKLNLSTKGNMLLLCVEFQREIPTRGNAKKVV